MGDWIIFEITESEFMVSIELTRFSKVLQTILTQNLDLTREQLTFYNLSRAQ